MADKNNNTGSGYDKFKEQVNKAKAATKSMGKSKIKVQNIFESIKLLNEIGKNIMLNIKVNSAVGSLKTIKNDLKTIASKPTNVEIKAKDQTKGVISGIKDNIKNLKSMILSETSKKIFNFTIGEAMKREDRFAANSKGYGKTASAQIKDIKESFGGLGANLVGVTDNGQIEKGGVFDTFKQQLPKILTLLDKFKKSDAFKIIKKDLSALAIVLSKIPGLINKYINAFKKSNVFKIIKKDLNSLVGAFNKIPSAINKYVMPAFGKFKNIANKYIIPAISSVYGVVKKYSPLVVGKINQLISKLVPKFKKLWGAIEKNIIPIIQDLWGRLQKVLPGIGDLFSSAFDLAVIVMGKAVDIFVSVSDGVKTMYDKIKPFLDWAADLFNKLAGKIRDAVSWLEKWNEKRGNKKNMPGGGTQGLASDSGQIQEQALGTSYFSGGWTWIGEQGPELMKLPGGAQILDNRTSQNMLGGSVRLGKLADTLVVREDSDIDKIADALAKKLTKVGFNCA